MRPYPKSENPLSYQAVSVINQITKLEDLRIRTATLNVDRCELTCNEAECIAQLTGLRTLDISENAIGDSGIKALVSLKKLTVLDVRKGRVMKRTVV